MADELDTPRVSKRFLRALLARVMRCPTDIRVGPGLKMDRDKDGSVLLSLDTATLPKAGSQ